MCKSCKKETILLSEELLNIDNDRYLVCPYCCSQKITVRGAGNDLKQCMEHSSYKRVKGAIRQR